MTVTVVRRPDEGAASWFLNSLVTTKVTTAETGGAYNVTEHLVSAAANPPAHVHHEEDEAFYVLEGAVRFFAGDREPVDATAGTFAFAARGEAHRFEVLTPTARMLVIGSGKPADDVETFFHGAGTPASDRVLPQPSAPDLDRLAIECARTKIELLV
ncbi:MAG TPA: cupin domain-containing protein [Acidimicrobiales bacterium]|nr:cupin domain-containing protein [Acidimicrobiales bacterium]